MQRSERRFAEVLEGQAANLEEPETVVVAAAAAGVVAAGMMAAAVAVEMIVAEAAAADRSLAVDCIRGSPSLAVAVGELRSLAAG